MIILGLHFGHDAAVTVVKDGVVLSYILRERYSRVKHAMTLTVPIIDMALKDAGISLADVDYCAISSTQGKELIIDDPDRVQVTFEKHPRHKASCTTHSFFEEKGLKVENLLRFDLMKYVFGEEDARNSLGGRIYSQLYPEGKHRNKETVRPMGWLDNYINDEIWEQEKTLAEIAATDHSYLLKTDRYRYGFHYPVTFTMDAVKMPAYFIDHHFCHAASVFYQSAFQDAAILTHDGHSRPRGYNAGMFYYGVGHKIYPVCPHHLFLGSLYDSVGGNLNLGIIGQAGKLMGLASWGQPRFFGREFVGNWVDFKRGRSAESDYRKDWFEHCLALAEGMGYDLSHLGDKEHMTAPINADIAASTQKLFEECISAAVEALYDTLSESGVRTLNLCMSGGTALNCPANSVVWQRGRFWNVFVEPGCDDSGIAIGAALALYHNVFDQPLPERTENYQMSPYLGQSISKDDILIALKQRENRLNIELQNDVSAIAKELASNKVVAWFDGRSEIGPRALGHRSIFADPRNEENWSRVNRIKGREMWRPLAPAVLEEESKKWFRGAPIPSPYMLFTASVKSSTVPSITHVDGSARVQTVNKSAGSFYALLQEFYKITGVPIILNTSFNGPGEPIVETPQEALAFFLNSECDLLWLEGYLVTRKVR